MVFYNSHLDLSTAEGRDIPLRGNKTAKTTERDCLKCQKSFDSLHKFNRLCKKCKSIQDPDLETKGGINLRFGESLTSERPNYY